MGRAVREGSVEGGGLLRPNAHDMLQCPSKTPGKDTPTDPERKAVPRLPAEVALTSAGAEPRKQPQQWSVIAGASAPSAPEALMASSLARSRE